MMEPKVEPPDGDSQCLQIPLDSFDHDRSGHGTGHGGSSGHRSHHRGHHHHRHHHNHQTKSPIGAFDYIEPKCELQFDGDSETNLVLPETNQNPNPSRIELQDPRIQQRHNTTTTTTAPIVPTFNPGSVLLVMRPTLHYTTVPSIPNSLNQQSGIRIPLIITTPLPSSSSSRQQIEESTNSSHHRDSNITNFNSTVPIIVSRDGESSSTTNGIESSIVGAGAPKKKTCTRKSKSNSTKRSTISKVSQNIESSSSILNPNSDQSELPIKKRTSKKPQKESEIPELRRSTRRTASTNATIPTSNRRSLVAHAQSIIIPQSTPEGLSPELPKESSSAISQQIRKLQQLKRLNAQFKSKQQHQMSNNKKLSGKMNRKIGNVSRKKVSSKQEPEVYDDYDSDWEEIDSSSDSETEIDDEASPPEIENKQKITRKRKTPHGPRKRKPETPEQRERRLALKRVASKRRWGLMTPEQRAALLEYKRKSKEARFAHLDEEEKRKAKAEKRQYMREYMKQRRALETEEEKRKRLDQVKLYDTMLRAKRLLGEETEEEKQRRLRKVERTMERRRERMQEFGLPVKRRRFKNREAISTSNDSNTSTQHPENESDEDYISIPSDLDDLPMNDSSDDDDNSDIKRSRVPNSLKNKKLRGRPTKAESERKRKLGANRTEEDRKRDREQKRKYREKKVETQTPEEREAQLIKWREKHKRYREKMTPEQKAEVNRKILERAKRKKENETEEEAAERRAKERERARRSRANRKSKPSGSCEPLTEEQLAERRRKGREARRRYLEAHPVYGPPNKRGRKIPEGGEYLVKKKRRVPPPADGGKVPRGRNGGRKKKIQAENVDAHAQINQNSTDYSGGFDEDDGILDQDDDNENDPMVEFFQNHNPFNPESYIQQQNINPSNPNSTFNSTNQQYSTLDVSQILDLDHVIHNHQQQNQYSMFQNNQNHNQIYYPEQQQEQLFPQQHHQLWPPNSSNFIQDSVTTAISTSVVQNHQQQLSESFPKVSTNIDAVAISATPTIITTDTNSLAISTDSVPNINISVTNSPTISFTPTQLVKRPRGRPRKSIAILTAELGAGNSGGESSQDFTPNPRIEIGKMSAREPNESDAEYTARKRAYMRDYMRARRQAETPEQKRARLDQIKEYDKRLREKTLSNTETEEEREIRLKRNEKERERKAAKRAAKIAAGIVIPRSVKKEMRLKAKEAEKLSEKVPNKKNVKLTTSVKITKDSSCQFLPEQ